MKFTEFEKSAKKRVAERHDMTTQQLDEILPALAMTGRAVAGAAGAVGRVGAKMGAKVGGAMARTGANVASKVGAKAVQGAQGAGRKMAAKVGKQANDMLARQMLKKGGKLPLPAGDGGKQKANFQIDNVKGDEVTLVNPKPKPGEPVKTVHSKKELEPILKGLAGL
jgi:hypothetical protein